MFAILLVFHLQVFLADNKSGNGHHDLSQNIYEAFPEYGLIQILSFFTFWS